MSVAAERFCVVDRPDGKVVPPQSNPCEGLPLLPGMQGMLRRVRPKGEVRHLVPPCGSPQVTGLEKLVFQAPDAPDSHTLYLLSGDQGVHTAIVVDTHERRRPYLNPVVETLAVTVIEFIGDGKMNITSQNGHGLETTPAVEGDPTTLRKNVSQGLKPVQRFTFS